MKPPLWRRILCWLNFHQLTSKLEQEGRPKNISDIPPEELADLLRSYCIHCSYDPDKERRDLLKGNKIV